MSDNQATSDKESNLLVLTLTALSFAAERHRNQRRKDANASPYINHPIALVQVLIQEAGITDPIILCAGFLHDTVENTDTSLEELEIRFGPAIAGIVREVTDDKTLPKAVRKQLQIEHASHASYPARLIKLADKICNLRDITQSSPTDWSPEQRRGYADRARQVAEQMAGTHAALESVFHQAYANAQTLWTEPDSPLPPPGKRPHPDVYDEMDCRPGGHETGVRIPESLAILMERAPRSKR